MQDYRKLDVWTKSHELALDVHRVLSAEAGGAGVDADLRRTLHRAAVAIPVRIVIGCEAEAAPDFASAMSDAMIAVDELAYLLRFGRDAEMMDAIPYAKLEARANQLRAMLGALNRTVRLKLGAASRPAAAGVPAGGEADREARDVRRAGSSPRRSRPRSTS